MGTYHVSIPIVIIFPRLVMKCGHVSKAHPHSKHKQAKAQLRYVLYYTSPYYYSTGIRLSPVIALYRHRDESVLLSNWRQSVARHRDRESSWVLTCGLSQFSDNPYQLDNTSHPQYIRIRSPGSPVANMTKIRKNRDFRTLPCRQGTRSAKPTY